MPFVVGKQLSGTGTHVAACFNNRQQTIVGFGAHDRNVGQLTDAQAAMFFDSSVGGTGIGLSVLGGGIEVGGGPSSFYSNMTKADSYGAKIIARPWSAPGALKDNGTDNNGGHLLSANYSAWANTLAAFQGLMQSNAGVNLYALGVQNEPDFTASYESMLYTTAEMVAFLKVLGPLVKALTPVPLIVLPETANWDNAQAFATAVLADVTAAQYIDAGGAHQYSGTPAVVAAGKPTWQTEQSGVGDTFDATITHGLTTAKWIHDALTLANAAMWLYWELNGQGTDNEGLVGQNSDFATTKRLYTMGNYSKFVRPGMVRCGLAGVTPPANVSITTFINTATLAFVIVAINQNVTPSSFSISLDGLSAPATRVTPWITSVDFNLASQPALGVVGGLFRVTLAANSVTSFVGTGGV